MQSAFGIDHGEIEKFAVPGLARLGTKIAGATTKAGAGLSQRGAAATKAAAKLGPPKGAKSFVQTPKQMGMQRGLAAAGRQQSSIGGRLTKLGGHMAARPGLTGGLAVGGAGAAGGGAFMANRRRY